MNDYSVYHSLGLLLLLLLPWVISMCFVVTGAGRRGRSMLAWFFIAFFLSPWFAGFGLLMLGEGKR